MVMLLNHITVTWEETFYLVDIVESCSRKDLESWTLLTVNAITTFCDEAYCPRLSIQELMIPWGDIWALHSVHTTETTITVPPLTVRTHIAVPGGTMTVIQPALMVSMTIILTTVTSGCPLLTVSISRTLKWRYDRTCVIDVTACNFAWLHTITKLPALVIQLCRISYWNTFLKGGGGCHLKCTNRTHLHTLLNQSQQVSVNERPNFSLWETVISNKKATVHTFRIIYFSWSINIGFKSRFILTNALFFSNCGISIFIKIIKYRTMLTFKMFYMNRIFS